VTQVFDLLGDRASCATADNLMIIEKLASLRRKILPRFETPEQCERLALR
jgi:hypothetical protein